VLDGTGNADGDVELRCHDLAGLAHLVGRATGQSMHSDPSHTIFDEMRSELQKLWNLCFTPKERHL